MFAILGEVEFDLITYFDGLEAQFGAEYAEHALIARKPRLQFVGNKLDEVKISLVFHTQYCHPETELARLRKALASHDALTLVLGNGDYKGRFVITDLSVTGRHTDPTGTLLAAEASISLREFTGDPAALPAPAVHAAGSQPQLPATGSLVAALPVKVPPTFTSGLVQVITTAKGALVTAGKVLTVVKTVRSLARDNPLNAVARLPELTDALGAALPGLGASAEQMAAFKPVASAAADIRQVAQNVIQVRKEVHTIADALLDVPTSLSGLRTRLDTLEGAVSRADAEMQKATAPLARLAAQAATRTL